MWIDDRLINRRQEQLVVECFIPTKKIVVLGRSNEAEKETNSELCQRDDVSVVKRLGGGGAVLLHPGCVVVSVGGWVKNPYQNNVYFGKLNHSIISCLNELYPGTAFSQKGFSDIVWKGKKFMGTSLFRSRQYFLYQASILVELRIEEIETYLRHPEKEPDYREGRSHRDFLTALESVNPAISVKDLKSKLDSELSSQVRLSLGEELVEPKAIVTTRRTPRVYF